MVPEDIRGFFVDNVFEFENGRVVDLNNYPPAPVLWVTNAIDMLLFSAPWRSWIGVSDSRFFGESFKLPPISSIFEPYLSFAEYRESLSDADASFSSAMLGYASTPSTKIADPSTLTGFIVLMVVLLTMRAVKSVLIPSFSKLGRYAALQTHGAAWVTSNEIRITKFGEYLFRLLFHSAMSFYGFWFFLGEPWWTEDPKTTFDKYPHQDVSAAMIWYYIIQSAYNLDAFISLLEMSITFRDGRFRWSEKKRGDFSEMLVHHSITNALLFASSLRRFQRIGCMVFFVHDVSDITVDLSKLANFLKWKVTTIACFVAMTCNWAVTRLYILPFVIFRNALTKSHYLLSGGASPLHYVCQRHFYYICFELLIALHFFWFLMFLRMLKAMVLKNEVHDYSEHKHGEQQDDVKKKDR